jgi:molybdate-binding protein
LITREQGSGTRITIERVLGMKCGGSNWNL